MTGDESRAPPHPAGIGGSWCVHDGLVVEVVDELADTLTLADIEHLKDQLQYSYMTYGHAFLRWSPETGYRHVPTGAVFVLPEEEK